MNGSTCAYALLMNTARKANLMARSSLLSTDYIPIATGWAAAQEVPSTPACHPPEGHPTLDQRAVRRGASRRDGLTRSCLIQSVTTVSPGTASKCRTFVVATP